MEFEFEERSYGQLRMKDQRNFLKANVAITSTEIENYIFRECPAPFERYKVNKLGEVFSMHYGRVMKHHFRKTTETPYAAVHQRTDGINSPIVPVATLVAMAFVKKPRKLHGLRLVPIYIDGNPKNVSADNLRWGTRAEKVQVRYSQGGGKRSVPVEFTAMDGSKKNFPSVSAAARFLNVDNTTIGRKITSGERYKGFVISRA